MQEPPMVGAFVVDIRDNRLALVQAVRNHRVCLRPPGGGEPWEAGPQHLRHTDAAEELRARVAAENARSRASYGC